MAKRKRPYVPKTKGCHECSQRRIHCDRTEPSCKKCAGKGIECSGFGGSWKFRNSFSSRTTKSRRSHLSGKEHARCVTTLTSSERAILINATGSSSGPMDESRLELSPGKMSLISDPFNLVSPGKMFLLDYFSRHIAPEMVIVDDKNNGWRHMVLPLAHLDELIMNAVVAASAFHLSARRASGLQEATKLYAKAIRELQKRRRIDSFDLGTQLNIILTILVLLVALMVNGSSDFPIVFQMLQSALEVIGGDSKLSQGELAQFLLRQIHKIRVYGAPFISQDVGTCTLIFEGQQSFDCLEYYRQLYPKHFTSFDRIVSLRQQAYNIYLYRASIGEKEIPSTQLVEDFKSTLQQMPEGSLGEHSLIWACFIAASESHLPEHQSYFDGFLKRQFSRSGFVNILRALDLLRKIRENQQSENWTKLLPEPQVFIM